MVFSLLSLDAAVLLSALYGCGLRSTWCAHRTRRRPCQGCAVLRWPRVPVVLDGVTVSLTAADPHVAVTPAARLELPPPLGTFTDETGSVVFYEHRAAAFAGLASALGR